MKLLLLVAILLVVDGSRSTPVPHHRPAKGNVLIQIQIQFQIQFHSLN